MLRIRLSRVGKKKQPAYRIVVADSRSPRDGAFLKIIGHYNPLTDPATLVVKEDEAVHWLEKGARPSETAAKLLTRLGVMERAGRAPVRYVGKDVPAAKKKEAKAPAEPKAQAAAPAQEKATVEAAAPAEEAAVEAAAPAEEAAVEAAEAPSEETPEESVSPPQEAEQPEAEPEATSEEPNQEQAENQE